jgi:hypothetical protein
MLVDHNSLDVNHGKKNEKNSGQSQVMQLFKASTGGAWC